MSNHIKGNWFVSVFQMVRMSDSELLEMAKSKNYRESTRRNALLFLGLSFVELDV